MRTQYGNETNKELIQHRTLFFTASTCFSNVSLSRKIHNETITDSKSPSAIKPFIKFWNLTCLPVVPSAKICCQLSSFLRLQATSMLFRFCTTTRHLRTYYNDGGSFTSLPVRAAGIVWMLAGMKEGVIPFTRSSQMSMTMWASHQRDPPWRPIILSRFICKRIVLIIWRFPCRLDSYASSSFNSPRRNFKSFNLCSLLENMTLYLLAFLPSSFVVRLSSFTYSAISMRHILI